MTDASAEQATASAAASAVTPGIAASSSGADAAGSAGDDASAAPAAEGNGEDVVEYQGPLPEFSDDEDESAQGTGASASRPGAGQASRGGKKKMPFAAIKARMGQQRAAGKKSQASKSSQEPVNDIEDPEAREKMLEQVLEHIRQQQGPEAAQAIQKKDLAHMLKSLRIDEEVLRSKAKEANEGAPETRQHKFWASQPVTQYDTAKEEIKEGPLEPNKAPDQIRQEPIPLHEDFRWVTMDLTNVDELREVYNLLTHHYVEDTDASFRFDYSADFIEWALKPYNYVKDWHIGVRTAETGKLVAFISGVPVELRIRSVTKKCAEINFLCIHKKLRAKRLAPVLIKEVTRRANQRGVFQAVYTGGVHIPTPVARCQYYHRTINVKKLVETGFSAVPATSTLHRMQRYFAIPEQVTTPGLREMEKKDLKAVGRLARAYLARSDVAPLLSNKDIEHQLYAGRGREVDGRRVGQVVWTYVVENPDTKEITDFFSFYSLPSTAMKAKPSTLVNAAYLFYYASTATPSTANLGDGSVATPVVNWKDETEEQRAALKERLNVLMTDALVLVNQAGFDVLNGLTLMDNSLFLDDLKFGKGDGYLHYYLYNYGTKPIVGGIDKAEGGSGVGLVML